MLDFLQKGGIVLWILVAISAFVIALIIERLLYFKRISVDEKKLYERIKAAVEKGHIDEALAICDQNLSPFAALMRTGIENRDYPRTIQKEMLEDAAAQEAPRLEKNIVAIGTIANIAPAHRPPGHGDGHDEVPRRPRQIRRGQRPLDPGRRPLRGPHQHGVGHHRRRRSPSSSTTTSSPRPTTTCSGSRARSTPSSS